MKKIPLNIEMLILHLYWFKILHLFLQIYIVDL